jgi:hypothetical protein
MIGVSALGKGWGRGGREIGRVREERGLRKGIGKGWMGIEVGSQG